MPETEDDDVNLMDNGPERPLTVRMCIVSRQTLPISQLIRFVAAPDGMLTPDIKRKLPGRGVWVEASVDKVQLAIKRKSFARGLKTAVTLPNDLNALIDRLLEQDALQSFSIANKAGYVVAGQAKVESEIANKPVIGIIHASEAAQDSVRKVRQALKRRFGEDYEHGSQILVLSPFGSVQMSLCLGREHVIHTCLLNNAVSRQCLDKCKLLIGYRGLLQAVLPEPVDDVLGLKTSESENFGVGDTTLKTLTVSG